jgi:small GTP-binding protein
MGNGGGHEVHHYHTQTVYQPTPAQKAELEKAKAEVVEYKKEAIRREDPKLFKQNQAKAIDKYVEKIKVMNIKERIDKKPGDTHVGFIGNISAGKSSLLNSLFGLKEPVALDHCTTECKPVYVKDSKRYYWDVPGTNDDYEFYNYNSLGFVASLDLVVIVYDNDPMMITNIIKVVYALKTSNKIVFVRTKCDQGACNQRPVWVVKSSDLDKLKALLPNPNLYCVSAHNVDKNDPMIYDWDALVKAL